MDNASKALIMAGAILIAIAIVGVGVYIFSSTSNITKTGQEQLNATSISLMNSNLRQYEGRIRGTQAKELIDYVTALNKNNGANITINGNASTTGAIANTSWYNVSMTVPSNSTTGAITTITINKAS